MVGLVGAHLVADVLVERVIAAGRHAVADVFRQGASGTPGGAGTELTPLASSTASTAAAATAATTAAISASVTTAVSARFPAALKARLRVAARGLRDQAFALSARGATATATAATTTATTTTTAAALIAITAASATTTATAFAATSAIAALSATAAAIAIATAGAVVGLGDPGREGDRPAVAVPDGLDEIGLRLHWGAKQRGRGAEAVQAIGGAGAHAGELEVGGGLQGQLIGRLGEAAVLGLAGGQAREREDVVTHRASHVAIVGAQRDGHAAGVLDHAHDLFGVEDAVFTLGPLIGAGPLDVGDEGQEQTAVGRNAGA